MCCIHDTGRHGVCDALLPHSWVCVFCGMESLFHLILVEGNYDLCSTCCFVFVCYCDDDCVSDGGDGVVVDGGAGGAHDHHFRFQYRSSVQYDYYCPVNQAK